MLELLNQIASRVAAGEAVAVCSLVRTRGSTPQKAGAMMLVLQDGRTLGTIGGGCVEAEVCVRALRLLGEGTSRLLTFKLDHDLGWDDGLICGGVMEVAVAVMDSAERAARLLQARDDLAAGRATTLRLDVLDDANQLAHFAQEVEPVAELLIAGAGHVGAALAMIARPLEFSVTVIDDRPDLATKERFPGVQLIIGSIDVELGRHPIRQNTSVVIVTRGHRHDGSALAAVVRSPAGYVGLIGSKRKVLTIFEDLRGQGVSQEMLSRVHAPIGLDIGAVTPGEIAVSIAAELIAHRRGVGTRAAAPMRLTPSQLDAISAHQGA